MNDEVLDVKLKKKNKNSMAIQKNKKIITLSRYHLVEDERNRQVKNPKGTSGKKAYEEFPKLML